MPTTPDFSDRDRTIVANTYTTVRRRSSVPHATFAAYWRDVHGPLCSRIEGLGWYVQHHFAREQDAHLWPPVEGVRPLSGYVLDGAVEIGFLSAGAQERFGSASSLLFSDEQNVFDETIAYDLPEGSRTLLDRQPDPIPNGADPYDRIHVHFGSRDDAGAGFEKMLTRLGEVCAAYDGAVKVRLHLPTPYDNENPAPPAPEVDHVVTDGRLRLAVLELAFTDSLSRRRFFASDEFASTVAEQQATAASITAFGVTGVFTFVRDEQLTTAGVRGSRVAELIDDLAALNQTEPEIRQLFVR